VSDAAGATSLPLDIIIEALFSTALLVVGVVLGSPALRPIQWATWAGEAEKDTRRPKGRKRFEADGGAEGVSMSWLEDRKGFWDVRVSWIILSSPVQAIGLRDRSGWDQAHKLIQFTDQKKGICGLGSKRWAEGDCILIGMIMSSR
jgi:hypothetical protein